MNIYISHSSSFDYKTKLYAPLKASSLAQEHSIFFPHDEENENCKTKDIIKNYDLLVAEVSYPSTGQGIELGWADAIGIPIICIHAENTRPSTSLRFITNRIFIYSDTEQLIDVMEREISLQQ